MPDMPKNQGEYAIETRSLTRRFGSVLAVDGLDLTVKPGSIFGFLGRNGAGKSSTIRMITGLLSITSGEVYVAGRPVALHGIDVRRTVGYLPDHPGTYDWMSGTEHLNYAAGLLGMSGREAVSRSTQLLDAVGLTDAAGRRAGEYSAGMRQRLSLAQALIIDPEVLVLDEPTAALDPVGRVEVLDLISSLAEGSTTVLMSTHLLGDVERICDTVAIIDAGRLVTQSSVDDLRRSYAATAIDIDLEHEVQELPALLEVLPFVQRVEVGSTLQGPSIRVHLDVWSAESRKATLAAVADHAGVIRSFHTVEPDLESVSLSLIGHTEAVRQP